MFLPSRWSKMNWNESLHFARARSFRRIDPWNWLLLLREILNGRFETFRQLNQDVSLRVAFTGDPCQICDSSRQLCPAGNWRKNDNAIEHRYRSQSGSTIGISQLRQRFRSHVITLQTSRKQSVGAKKCRAIQAYRIARHRNRVDEAGGTSSGASY